MNGYYPTGQAKRNTAPWSRSYFQLEIRSSAAGGASSCRHAQGVPERRDRRIVADVGAPADFCRLGAIRSVRFLCSSPIHGLRAVFAAKNGEVHTRQPG